jgi:hypothetical protein
MTTKSHNNANHNLEANVNFLSIFMIIKKRFVFILSFTFISTLFAFIYIFAQNPSAIQYKATATFVSPNISSIIQLNNFGILNESVETAYIKFLNNLSSKLLQKQLFIEGGYAKKLNVEFDSISSRDVFISSFLKSISLKTKVNKGDFELPYIFSMTGLNGIVISEFLDEMIVKADKYTVENFSKYNNQLVQNSLNELANKRNALFVEYAQDLANEIVRIKSDDLQKINDIENRIFNLRYKAKKKRENQILALSNAAILAKTLGYIDNNLEKFSAKNMNEVNRTIVINDIFIKNVLPDWYLYGESAILLMLEVIQNRVSDDPFIPELIDLENEIYLIKNNSVLKALESRGGAAPFIPEISALESERTRIEGYSLDSSNISVVRTNEMATYNVIEQENHNRLILLFTLLGSFFLSILIVILMSILKEDEIAI